MKIAYILPIDISKYDGVLNKVTSQVEAWEKFGEEVRVFLITHHDHIDLTETSLGPLVFKNLVNVYKGRFMGFIPIDLFGDWLGQRNVYSNVLDDVQKFQPEIVYARGTLFQPFYNRLGKRFKLILELNTDMGSEYKLQATQSIKYFFRYIYFLITNRFLFNRVAGLASVTFDIASIYQDIPNKVFPNSINVDTYNTDGLHGDGNLRIFFIGSPGMPWHGVDILMELAEQLDDVYFDIVGVSNKEFPLSPKNVTLHGYLHKQEYMGLIAKATATMASLAFYRNGMEEACPLKVREYLAFCKPVILPYKDTSFEQKGYPEWILQLPNSRRGILAGVDSIRQFLNRCHTFNITREEVKNYVHVDNIEIDRINFFKSIRDGIDVK